ncbi:MAG: pseudouridine-5'-phosphate glycosidase [Acidobacteriota bacterium]|nr:pseudouridine-5'-phosphate glycosidase [Acidobacteriota bacterium]
MSRCIEIGAEVREALADRRPVVALESTLIAHGLPRPQNLETALELERVVRREGAVPATVGIAAGRIVVGLDRQTLGVLAGSDDVLKVSRRGLATAVAAAGLGATTVAATMWIAARSGIGVMATGGIGGVHRGGESNLDVSADLREVGRTDVAVVCSGAKAILDLARTLEVLETEGVPVLGFQTDYFPAFYSRDSGAKVSQRVDSARVAAELLAIHRSLDLGSGVLITQPPPAGSAIERNEVEGWIETALAEAGAKGVAGEEVTPFLLARLTELSGGRTLDTNRALLVANASLAAQIAVELSRIETEQQ